MSKLNARLLAIQLPSAKRFAFCQQWIEGPGRNQKIELKKTTINDLYQMVDRPGAFPQAFTATETVGKIDGNLTQFVRDAFRNSVSTCW